MRGAPLRAAPYAHQAERNADDRLRRSAIVTVSSGSGPDRVVEVFPPPRRGHSSGGSASVHSPTSSGSRSFSSTSSDSWSQVEAIDDEDDGIEPLDSASQGPPRPRASRRHTTEVRPAPTRRHSSRRVEVEEPPRRRSSRREHEHHSRHRRAESRRTPSDDSGSVASYDDYYGHHGAPPPPRAGYPPGYRQSHGGYPPSVTSAQPYPHDPYAHQSALVPMPDPFGYPSQPNPFAPHGQQPNPFSPMSSAGGTSYFAADPHAPPQPQGHHHRPAAPTRPASFAAPSAYPGSELMGYPPSAHGYPPYGMPYPPPWAYAPSHSTSPPPKEDKTDDKVAVQFKALEALIAKEGEARAAFEKERLARVAAEAAEKEKKRLEAEAEKQKKEEVAAASKKAKEDAEKKAEEAADKANKEHEKKLKELETAKEEAEKKQKESEAEAAKLKPAPDVGKAPIKFKDAVGRKFSFPFHLCKTWKGMELLIKQAFLHIDVIGEHVHAGHYDLTGPDGEIILPQVWETMIQPDWEITMHMWPMEEDKKKDQLAVDAEMFGLAHGVDSLHVIDVGGKVSKGKGKGKDGKKSSKKPGSPDHVINVPVGGGIPVPPSHLPGVPGGMVPDPFAAGLMAVEERRRVRSKSAARVSPFQAWIVGGRPPKRRS